MDVSVSTSLVDRFRSLLEAVKEGCARERQWGLLAGPMALVAWIRTRRERKEAAAVMEQVKTLLEEFVALLAEVAAAEANAGEGADAVAPPSPRLVRFAAQSPIKGEGEGEEPPPQPSPARAGEGASGAEGAVAAPHPPASGSICAGKNGSPSRAPPPGSSPGASLPQSGEGNDAQSSAASAVNGAGVAGDYAGAPVAPTGPRFSKPDLSVRETCVHFVAISKLYHLFVGNTVFTMAASSAS
jgi:hypothetical protein